MPKDIKICLKTLPLYRRSNSINKQEKIKKACILQAFMLYVGQKTKYCFKLHIKQQQEAFKF
jgi:hypothetical protein